MPGLFSTLNTSYLGMQAQQRALQTTSHNIANANTEGFSRQRVVMEPTPALPAPSVNAWGEAGQLGTGVIVSAIERIRDQLLDVQLRGEQSTLGFWDEQQVLLEQAEVVFNEPTESGLNTLFNQFWSDWQELSKNAASPPVRTTVLETAISLSDALKHTYNQLDTLRSDINDKLDVKVRDLNSTVDQIAHLNSQIIQITVAGDSPNDLFDQRDLLLDKLSELTNFKAVLTGSGTVNIDLGQSAAITDYSSLDVGQLYRLDLTLDSGRLLQAGFVANDDTAATAENIRRELDKAAGIKYSADFDAAAGKISVYETANPANVAGILDLNDMSANNLTKALVAGDKSMHWKTVAAPSGNKDIAWDTAADSSIEGQENGAVSGMIYARDDVLKAYTDGLNQMAKTLIEKINEIHSAGFDVAGNPGQKFFSGADASDIGVAITKPEEIAAATDDQAVPGDGSNALLIAQLKTGRLADGDPVTGAGLGNASFDEFYKNFIAALGVEAHEAGRMVDNQQALTQQLINRRDSISGVSIDEEMTSVIQFQHAYNASAKVISVVDELLDTLINGMLR